MSHQPKLTYAALAGAAAAASNAEAVIHFTATGGVSPTTNNTIFFDVVGQTWGSPSTSHFGVGQNQHISSSSPFLYSTTSRTQQFSTYTSQVQTGTTTSGGPIYQTNYNRSTFTNTYFNSVLGDQQYGEYQATAAGGTNGGIRGTGIQIEKLGSGMMIGGGDTFGADFFGERVTASGDVDNYVNNTGGWAVGDTGFIGLALNIGGNSHYGWAEIEILSDMVPRVLGFAYEDQAGVPIEAGATIPEPATTALLLASGAAGFVAWRRRQQKAS